MKPQKSADIRRFLLRQCSNLGVPVSGIFELTPRCNLKCKMCYVRLTKEQMAPLGREFTADEWIEIARACKDKGMVFLLITGGEPTLREDFPKIYEALAQMGLSITVNTNGTMLSEEIKALWHRLPPAQVNLTVYGVCREDYEAFCSNRDAFDRVLETLDWLKEEGIFTHLNTTITPQNYEKWIALEEFAKERDMELRVTAYCFPPSRRCENSSCLDFSRLSAEKAGELMALDILFRDGIEAICKRAENASLPTQTGCDLDNGEPIQCMAGSSQFWLTWNGNLTPCGMLSTPSFNLIDTDFDSAWEKLKAACSQIRLCTECNSCPHQKSCLNCAAVTFAETGRFDGKPEYMCRFNEAYRNTLKRIIDEYNEN